MMTDEEFLAKISWEGGVFGALEYGLKTEELNDLSPLKKVWAELSDSYRELQPLVHFIESQIDEF